MPLYHLCDTPLTHASVAWHHLEHYSSTKAHSKLHEINYVRQVWQEQCYGEAGQGRAWYGRSGQGRSWQGRAGQGRADYDRAGQIMAGVRFSPAVLVYSPDRLPFHTIVKLSRNTTLPTHTPAHTPTLLCVYISNRVTCAIDSGWKSVPKADWCPKSLYIELLIANCVHIYIFTIMHLDLNNIVFT